MKKITILVMLLFSVIGNAQTSQNQIQDGAVLDEGWDLNVEGGLTQRPEILDDLTYLFKNDGKPSDDLTIGRGAPIYKQITYLMPLEEAVKMFKPLKLIWHNYYNGYRNSMVNRPGMPKGMIYTYYLGRSPDNNCDRPTEVSFITDYKNQVMSVFFEDYNKPYFDADSGYTIIIPQNRQYTPKTLQFFNMRYYLGGYKPGEVDIVDGRSYPFVLDYKIKTLATGAIEMTATEYLNRRLTIRPEYKKQWEEKSKTKYTQQQLNQYRSGRICKWYIPQPYLNLIRHCMQKAEEYYAEPK